jgi:signal transduction histidine kinase
LTKEAKEKELQEVKKEIEKNDTLESDSMKKIKQLETELKEAKDKLFTKFFRADNAKEQSPNGTGIGLYLVKRVVNDQNGRTIFSSEAGKGSIFGFRLPLNANKKSDVPSSEQKTPETSTKVEVKVKTDEPV